MYTEIDSAIIDADGGSHVLTDEEGDVIAKITDHSDVGGEFAEELAKRFNEHPRLVTMLDAVIAALRGNTSREDIVLDLQLRMAEIQDDTAVARQTRIAIDCKLNFQQLERKYCANGGCHPIFDRQDWRNVVANGDTDLGYWPWVATQILAEA